MTHPSDTPPSSSSKPGSSTDPEIILLRPEMRKPTNPSTSSLLTPLPRFATTVRLTTLQHRYLPTLQEQIQSLQQHWQRLAQQSSWFTPHVLELYQRSFLMFGLSQACNMLDLARHIREWTRLLNSYCVRSAPQHKPPLSLLTQHVQQLYHMGQQTISTALQSQTSVTPSPTTGAEKQEPHEKGTVLVIDNPFEPLQIPENQGEFKGIQYNTVSTAMEAVRFLRQMPPVFPNAIVLNLPSPPFPVWSIYDTIRNLSGIPTIPVLFLAHPQDHENIRQIYRVGVDELLQHPVSSEVWIQHLQKMLRQYRKQRLLQQGEFSPGMRLHQQYEVLGEIARGGMGIVYLVQHLSSHTILALKILSVHQSRNNRNLQRFQRETLLLHKLKHPSLIRLVDSGLFYNIPYYVMPYLLGGSLVEHLKTGAFPPQVALAITMQIADALHHAHEQGVLHRDLKSSNILFDEACKPILTDFGSALPIDDDQPRLTNTGNLIGTPCYMSPEQFTASHLIDHRSDIFSLGFVLYEMLAGYHPLADLHPATAIARITMNQYPKLSEINSALPAEVIAICERAMAPDRDARYETALAFAKACHQQLQQMQQIPSHQPS